ncbi:MAG: hypothetical protein ACKOW2_01075 [Sphingobacteriaceae bacterium]
MKEAKKAVFDFEGYKISKFSFTEPVQGEVNAINLGFAPSGKYFPDDRRFILYLQFTATIENNNEMVKEEMMSVALESSFLFDSEVLSLDSIPPYFYRNSLAIIFPYLRAFVSTLTFQANIKPIILPILNLTTLETPLKSKIEVIETRN